MFYLGLILPVCFVAGYTGATIPTQWGLLSIVLALSLWRKAPFNFLHELGVMFCLYALASALWATNYHTSVLGLWFVAIWALSFRLGGTITNLEPLWRGLAIGLSVSSAVAVAQALGYRFGESNGTNIAGLLYNATVQGLACALVLVALVSHRLWWYTPPLLVGLALSQSRGAVLVLIATLFAKYTHWLLALAALVVSSLAATALLNPSDNLRLVLWGQTLRNLSPFGWGPNSYNDFFIIIRQSIYHAEFVHNDYLQLIFEYGIGAAFAFTILATALAQSTHRDWPVLLAFAIAATFYFPLYTPLPAFIGCVVVGHLLRDYDLVGSYLNHRRLAILSRNHPPQTGTDQGGLVAIPVAARNSQSEG